MFSSLLLLLLVIVVAVVDVVVFVVVIFCFLFSEWRGMAANNGPQFPELIKKLPA